MKSSVGGGSGSIADLIYPVGAIYLSTYSTRPQTLFGGTWERIQDRFIFCVGRSMPAGTTGGEASHTLTENEIPPHTHYVYGSGFDTRVPGFTASVGDSSDSGRPLAASRTGGGQPHNNMPPYLAVYGWERTA